MKNQVNTKTVKALAFTALLFAMAPIHAEELANAPVKRNPNELSIRYSNLTGYGVAYQRNFLDHYYVRTTAWFKYYEYQKGDKTMPVYKYESNKNYNFGLDLQRDIIAEKRYRVFGFMGGGYAIREKMTNDYREPGSSDTLENPGNVQQQLITAGLGGGIEYFFAKNVSGDLDLSYKFDYDVDKSTKETTKETGLGVTIGLNLNF